jgi:hypothetical protein
VLLMPSKRITLPGPVSGIKHEKCYANADGNCSSKISKEHFISANYLEQIQLNNTAKVAGLTWQAPETFNLVPVKTMASNILCERHNNALSPLDAVFGSFAETVREFDRPGSTHSEAREISGSDIELWMLKCLVGLTASGNVKGTLKPECSDILFGRIDWPEGWGLYFANQAGEQIYHSNSLLIETMVSPDNVVLLGKLFIQGLPFLLVMGKPDNPQNVGVWRPATIIFKSPDSEKTITLSWDGGCGPAICLTRTGRYDGPSPNWKEWEKK